MLLVPIKPFETLEPLGTLELEEIFYYQISIFFGPLLCSGELVE